MKKGDKRKRDRAQRKRARRKQAGQRAHSVARRFAPHHIRAAREYPYEGCWVQDSWEEDGLAVVVVARRQPNGNIVFGNYLVDYYCLGLKNTFWDVDVPQGEFDQYYVATIIASAGSPISISTALAHEIVHGGIEYAAQFGFRPQRDFALSRYVLDPPDKHPRSGEVEFGKDGKPFYVSGPHDNVDAIMRQLTRTVGEDNFHFMIDLDRPPDDLFDDDSGC